MTNFFLEELRKIYGDGRVIHDPQFVGECCYGSLGDLRVKARFTKDIVANQYPYLTVSILNPTKVEIDSVRMKIGEIVSRSCRSTNPNLRNTEPHIWVDGKTPQWYIAVAHAIEPPSVVLAACLRRAGALLPIRYKT